MPETKQDKSRFKSFHEWVGTVGVVVSILAALGLLGGGAVYVFVIMPQHSEPPHAPSAEPLTTGNVHYAAIWEQASGPPWLAYHGLSSAQYQQKFDELTGKGFRLVEINGYSAQGQERLAVIFEQRTGPRFMAYHGLTSAQYQQKFDELTSSGFRLVEVSGYSVGDQERFAVIFEQRGGPPLRAVYGLTSAQYQQKFDELAGNGFRLVQVSGYSVNGQEHLAGIFEQGNGPPWLAYHGLTSAQFQQKFDELTGKGFRLVGVSGCSVGGQERFAVIFEQQEGPPFHVLVGLTPSEYQQRFDELSGQGMRLVQVSGYSVG